MTVTHGNKRVIVDADALIGLIHEDDALHERSVYVVDFLDKHKIETIIPYPIVLEAATTLAKDKQIRRPDLAQKLLNDYTELTHIEEDTVEIAKLVASLYDPRASKKNSPFDHYVAATAKNLRIDIIFSFDTFYTKLGFILAEKLLLKNTY